MGSMRGSIRWPRGNRNGQAVEAGRGDSDIGMPYLNGLDATRQLLQHDQNFKVIVLTITDSDQVIREALNAGARGFVLKSDAARDLVSAVEALESNRMFFTPRVNDLVMAGLLVKTPPVDAD